MLVIVLILILILLLYVYFGWNHKYWIKHKIPHDEPNLIFGSLKNVINGSKHFGINYMDMYKKFSDVPYFGFYKIRDPSLIIRDVDLVKNVLIKDFSYFTDNDFQVSPEADPIWAQNLFSQNGDVWKKNRSAWSAALTASKLKAMYETLNRKCENLNNYLSKHAKNNPNEPIETRQMITNYFIDAILASIVGIETNSFEMKNNPYRNITQSLFNSTLFDGLTTMSFMFFPKLAKIFGIKFVPKRVQNELIAIAKDILKTRQATGFQKVNAFDVIIGHGDNAKEGVTEIEVAGTLFSFLLDGTETSAGVMAYMLYQLALDVNIQSKLRAEIDDALEEGNGEISYDKLHSLSYLDMIISETMRMYPPALSLQRLCTKPYELPPINAGDKPFRIPVGMPVITPVYAIHHDPEYYPDPEKFDPERFSDENKKNIPKGAFIPFGEGPRICVGFRLALNQTKVGIVNILKNFEIRLAPRMKGKPPVIDPNIFVMKPIDGLWVTFHERLDKK